MNHLMIDLETLATTPDTAIVSVGAVVFEMDVPGYGESFHEFPDLGEQVKNGRTIDPETLKWWMAQSDQAREAFGNKPEGPLKDVLRHLVKFYKTWECAAVWGHGSSFDISIIEHAMRQYGIKTPWSHRDVRDTRTMYALHPSQARLKAAFRGTHNAVEDCKDQILALQMVDFILQEKGVYDV